MDRRIAADGASGRGRRLTRRTERLVDVHGAAEHNLRDVDVTFGPGLTAVVGVSGSGKSSLAFDVVYAEARRRFMESFALGGNGARVPAAQVRRIEGLGPAVAVAQNVLNRNPASTVATSVGLHPFLRILYSRFAEVACPALRRAGAVGLTRRAARDRAGDARQDRTGSTSRSRSCAGDAAATRACSPAFAASSTT